MSELNSEELHEAQNAWPGGFPPNPLQPLDRLLFGRMDRSQESVGADQHGSTSKQPQLPSLQATPLPLSVIFSQMRNAYRSSGYNLSPAYDRSCSGADNTETPSRHGRSTGIDHTMPPSLNYNSSSIDRTIPSFCTDDMYELDDLSKLSQSGHVHYSLLPGEITPYLGLRARLTQTPINRWTVLLLLVLARILILFDGLNTNIADVQQKAATACSNVENIGSIMASMPYYLSMGGKLCFAYCSQYFI